MKKNILLILFFLTASFCYTNESENFQTLVKPDHYEKMKILIGVIDTDNLLEDIAKRIKADLELGEQFDIEIKNVDKLKSKEEVSKFVQMGFELIIFINFSKNDTGIDWRLYDNEAQMLKGKKVFSDNGQINTNIAHKIADELLQELAGQDGCFESTIVACKKVPLKRNKYYTHLYTLHPSETLNNIAGPNLLMKESTICLAPRWHPKKPLLYYSKHTAYNVRLMCLDMNKNKSVVSNFDGLNLTPAFNQDGKIILSITQNGKGRIFEYNYDKINKKSSFKALTKKNIHAFSPSFIDQNNVVICVIGKSNRPRLAILDTTTRNLDFITAASENCVSPNYSNKTNKILYCKRVNGYMQVFTYDINTKEHKQITFTSGHKDSCCWSPCGNYIVFSSEKGKTSRIVLYNTVNKTSKYLTPVGENWSNPTWSPIYEEGIFN